MKLCKLIQKDDTIGTSPKDYKVSKKTQDNNSLMVRHPYFAGVWVDEEGDFWMSPNYKTIIVDRSYGISYHNFNGYIVESFGTEGQSIVTCISKDNKDTYTVVCGTYDPVMFVVE